MSNSDKSKKTNSKQEIQKEADIYVGEEILENKEVECSEEKIEKVSDNEAIDRVVEEYNGEIKKEEKEEKRIRVREGADVAKTHKLNKKSVIVTLSVILAMIIVFVSLAVINKMNENVYRNVYLNQKNLTGMTSAQLTDYLKGEQDKLTKTTLKIYQGNEEILEIVPSDIDFEIDAAKIEKDIFGFGRDSNIIKNNIDIFVALIAKKEYDMSYKYDVNKLSEIVKEIKETIDEKVIDDSYVIDETQYKLIITKGKSGNTIDEEIVKNKIISSLANCMGEYKLNIVKGTPSNLDVDVVYSNVKREPKDAYIDKSTTVYKFVPHQVGLDFDKEELKAILEKDENKVEGKVIEYSLKAVEPKVKTSDIKWELYEYQISSYTTYFSTADSNRVNNLRVALNLLNGKVIMPGEVFSYNSVVGGATAAQGFKPAATFVGGRVVNEVGGGICQTVSTLYNTALLANLEIVQRKAHSLPVGYVPGSRDATVYHPSIDFKFKNTREYPIKIVTSFNSNGSLTVSLYGTKEQNEYVVSISSKNTGTIPYTTQYIEDGSMEKGREVVVQNGTNGYTSESYITKKLNGKVVSTTLLSKDTYKAVAKIVRIGTKVVSAPSVTPPATPTPPVTEPVTPPTENNTPTTPTTPESGNTENIGAENNN